LTRSGTATSSGSIMSKFSTPALLIFLLLLAAIPRLLCLGALGFYGDEETTAFPAKSVAEGRNSVLPSGMPYQRALPYTYLNAASAKFLGADKEYSYRIPAAIIGTLSVPIIFLMLSPLVGRSTALIASVLLAVSEWHVLTSREARMYGPFLFFFAVAALATLRWSFSARHGWLWLAVVSFVAAATLHVLSVFLLLLILLPLLFPDVLRVRPAYLICFALFALLFSAGYYQFVEAAAYTDWGAGSGAMSLQRSAQVSSMEAVDAWLSWALAAALVTGLALAIWAVRLGVSVTEQGPWVAAFLTGSLLVAMLMAAAGQAYGAALGITLYVLAHPRPMFESLAPLRNVLFVASVLFMVAVGVIFLSADDPVAAVKRILGFPFPYVLMFLATAPGTTLLAILGIVLLSFSKPVARREAVLRVAALAFIVALAVVGAASRWQGMRYFTPVYPLYILLAAYAAHWIASAAAVRFSISKVVTVSAVVVVILSGVTGGNGLPQSMRVAGAHYGDRMQPDLFGFDVYPDHRTAGLFVRSALRASDIVVAEDQIQQRWYAGRVDYWLRSPAEGSTFLHTDSAGALRDIYVASRVVTPDTLATLMATDDRRIWLITSAEARGKRELGLSADQREWLAEIERGVPAFTGEDGVTAVYCVNCRDRTE